MERRSGTPAAPPFLLGAFLVYPAGWNSPTDAPPAIRHQ